ncbi:hypothetical protein [Thalassotalea profundi]|uniref:Lipoprotein n=1 Tax=Thalassotalea profundi TaxID=2036687 RepID=A0ABQ3IGM6_9GAMM|nr:hypothetical protein [Thalassotalea profundi]GHE81596.1 hypothetical protein GCM10011501_07310 [Thalassotalea profundi]
MFKVNKKFGSLVFGCVFAASYIWLVNIGSTTSFFDTIPPPSGFSIAHYSGGVTASLAILFSGILLVIMTKGFNVCASEHPFWLALPSIYLISLTAFSAFELLPSMLYAAIPTFLILVLTAVYFRISRQKKSSKTA